MAAVVSILLDVLSLAASVGIPLAIDFINEKKSIKRGTDPVKLAQIVNKVLSQLRGKSSRVYSEAVNKLNSIPSDVGSASFQQHIREMRNKATDKVKAAEQIVNDVNTAVDSTNSIASAYSVLPASVRKSKAGQEIYDQVINDTNKSVKEFEQRINNLKEDK